ncbi:MAG: DNA alkylation repair protein [Nitrospirae bacterium]|nr:DNA alkylation repair protein [Nitrospirota bacterium]
MKSPSTKPRQTAPPNSFHTEVREALERKAHRRVKESYERYFKGAVQFVGVRTPAVRAVERAMKPHFLRLTVPEASREALALLASPFMEERQIAVSLLRSMAKSLSNDFLDRLEPLFDGTVKDWGSCDGVAGRVLRHLLKRDPKFLYRVISWSTSRNLWRQRASAVAFVNEARHGRYNKEILTVCENIVGNPERFVQLGLGWVLRELFLANRDLALGFLAAHYPQISREGLRYAIEKMPVSLRERILTEHAKAQRSGTGRR